MTQKVLIEIIQRSFSEVGEKEARERLNVAKADFVRETRIIQDVASFTTSTDTTDYGFSSITNAAGGAVIEIYDVELPDVDNDNLVWFVERNRDTLVIGEEDENSSGNITVNSIDSGKTVNVYGVFGDSDFTNDLTETPDFDTEFHMGPVYLVLRDLHDERGNINSAETYDKRYRDVRLKAKRAAGSRGIKGDYRTSRSLDSSPRRLYS